MIKDIRLLIYTNDGKEIGVELEPQRVRAVVKLLGLEYDGSDVVMTRRKWKRENKVLIPAGQGNLFG